MKQFFRVVQGTVRLYLDKKIPRSAAALSYYLTMSFFPLVICLYNLLGNNYARMLRILDFLNQFLAPETTRYIKSFLNYVAVNRNPAMTAAGVVLLLTSASAAVRTMQMTVGEMQGGRRFQGMRDILFSILFSVAFLAAMYFAILVILTGQDFLELIESRIPIIHISRAWSWMRFLVLGGLEFVILWAMYDSMRRRDLHYFTAPGALFGTLAFVLMSWIFSVFIAASAKYSLVYGSLASLILLMLWLFLCCQAIYLGAAVNLSIWQVSQRAKNKENPLSIKNE